MELQCIEWYNPGWEEVFPYEFLPASPEGEWCPEYHEGDAYYFPFCEEFAE